MIRFNVTYFLVYCYGTNSLVIGYVYLLLEGRAALLSRCPLRYYRVRRGLVVGLQPGEQMPSIQLM